MRIIKNQEISYEISMTKDEFKILKNCMAYCKHRLQKHPDSGIRYTVNKMKFDVMFNEVIKIQ